MHKRGWIAILCCISLLMVMGCSLTSTSSATSTAPEILRTPTPTVVATPEDERWQSLADGVAMQLFRVEPPYTTSAFEMPVIRINPEAVVFKVHYQPQVWYTIEEWQSLLDDPLLVVNASFFHGDTTPIGLVVTDGEEHGFTLRGYGGMFQVGEDEVRVRSLVTEPYYAGEFDQVAQGFPLLVEPGGNPARTGRGFDDPARRTMVAQGKDGLIYIMVAPNLLTQFTLRNAQNWLMDSELDLDAAFNFDGGRSSGLFVQTPSGSRFYPATNPIPVVLAVYSR